MGKLKKTLDDKMKKLKYYQEECKLIIMVCGALTTAMAFASGLFKSRAISALSSIFPEVELVIETIFGSWVFDIFTSSSGMLSAAFWVGVIFFVTRVVGKRKMRKRKSNEQT